MPPHDPAGVLEPRFL